MSAAGFFARRVRSLHGAISDSVCGEGIGSLDAGESAEMSEDNLELRHTVENCSDSCTVSFLGRVGDLVDVSAFADNPMEHNRV